MGWRNAEFLGEQIVKSAHDRLHIDDRYLVSEDRGFYYWAGEAATTIHTDEGIFRQSQVTYRVTCETDLVRCRGKLRELIHHLENVMDETSFSCLTYNRDKDILTLYCCVYANSDRSEWLERTFCAAVALQIAEAYEIIEELKPHNVSVALSGHPNAGLREDQDANLTHAFGMFHPSGDSPSSWLDVAEWKQLEWVMEREASRWETDHASFVKAGFHWACGEGDIAFELRTDEPHKRLGNGLHATLSVPMRLNADGIGHLMLDLNSVEKTDYKRAHTLGSWCNHNGQLAFRMFIPNALYDPCVLEEVGVAMSTRAIWVNEWFYAMKMAAAQQQTQS